MLPWMMNAALGAAVALDAAAALNDSAALMVPDDAVVLDDATTLTKKPAHLLLIEGPVPSRVTLTDH